MGEISPASSGTNPAGFDECVLWQMLPLGICVIDREFVVHGWNRQLESWTKLTFETVRGRSLPELFPEFTTRKFADRIAQVFESGVPTVLSSALHRYFLPIQAPGSPLPQFMVQETRILRIGDDTSRVVVTMADMTTAVRQQEKLRRDRAALIQTQDALEAANQSLQASLEQIAATNRQLQGEIQERKQIEIELRRQTNELIASRARESDHRMRLEEFVRDLTQARHQAEAAARTKSEFLANMSHEIRTPMTAILGYVELLEDPEFTEEQRRQAGKAIRCNGDHLLDIINDILDISKIEAGKLSVEMIPVVIREIVGDVIDMMKPRANDRGLRLEAWIPATIPRRILTDPLRLRQILINLVGNAIKFTHEGSITVRLAWLDPGTPLGRVQIEVEDTGIGISEETVDRLFQPFVQADTQHTRQYGGTGLGLAISQRLAVMLGGHIDLKTAPGNGSTFTVQLPCEVALPEEQRFMSSGSSGWPDGKPAAGTSLAGFRILVVDDAADNRKLIGFHLRKAGAELELAQNGQEALERISGAANHPFDVVLMDMQMPVLDGYEATRQLRLARDMTPVIAITAHALAEDRDRCLQAGCNDYLTKPIQRDELLETTARWARNSMILAMH